MAKGRSAKGKASSGDNKKEETQKVSAADAESAVVQNGETVGGGEWGIVPVTGKEEAMLCRTDGCKEVAVATWATKTEPDDKWPLRETCQEKEHDGWPEGFDRHAETSKADEKTASTKETPETPTYEKEKGGDTSMDVDSKAPASESKGVDMEDDDSQQKDIQVTQTQIPSESKDVNMDDDDTQQEDINVTTDSTKNSKEDATDPDEEGDEDDDEEDEKWDLKKILSHDDVTKDGAIKCGTEECRLAACCLYVSSASGEKWYGCIDCQDAEFGGWPSMEELPVTSLDKDHIRALVANCSKKKRPAMPPFKTLLSPMRQHSQGSETNTITPLGSGITAQASKGSKATITPTPAKAAKETKKQSAAFLKKHAEWQQAAIKAGGSEARIVVKKDLAKPIIFNLLYDAMKPMNITQIHVALMATVPSPILKSCLDDMALDNSENRFYDSDDEDAAPKKAKKSEASGDYSGSLVFKGGRNPNSSLYYVDHTKQKNNGNGLEPDQRNELANNLAKAQEDESMLKAQLLSMTKETEQLLSEPTNEEATATLERQEAEMNSIREQLEAARELKVNEKHKKQTKKRIESLVAQWRKRKRLCMDFLITMEESTEGTISAKKCLAGDGQIDVESDETAIKNAIAYGKKKRTMSSRPPTKKMKVSRCLSGKTTGLHPSDSLTSGLTADVNFVAVRLDSAGQVQRVYLGDDE